MMSDQYPDRVVTPNINLVLFSKNNPGSSLWCSAVLPGGEPEDSGEEAGGQVVNAGL